MAAFKSAEIGSLSSIIVIDIGEAYPGIDGVAFRACPTESSTVMMAAHDTG